MLTSIAVIGAILCAIVLLGLFRSERRKRYNEFHRPVSTSGAMIYGDTGGAAGIGGGCGGGGGDGGGGGC
jgi:hypothetical protein